MIKWLFILFALLSEVAWGGYTQFGIVALLDEESKDRIMAAFPPRQISKSFQTRAGVIYNCRADFPSAPYLTLGLYGGVGRSVIPTDAFTDIQQGFKRLRRNAGEDIRRTSIQQILLHTHTRTAEGWHHQTFTPETCVSIPGNLPPESPAKISYAQVSLALSPGFDLKGVVEAELRGPFTSHGITSISTHALGYTLPYGTFRKFDGTIYRLSGHRVMRRDGRSVKAYTIPYSGQGDINYLKRAYHQIARPSKVVVNFSSLAITAHTREGIRFLGAPIPLKSLLFG